MIPRRLRLSRQDFESVTEGRTLERAQSPHFSLSYGSVEGLGGGGVVVPKKVEKSSVKRHLLKRRVREIIRPYCSKDRVLIVYARAGASLLPFDDVRAELDPLLKRACA